MGYLDITSKTGTRTIPIFQKILETARGGFSLDMTGLTVGETISAGTPMTFDEATRKAKKATLTGDEPDEVSDAKGLLKNDVIIEDAAPVDVVLRGTVYARRVTPSIDQAHRDVLPLIIFSESR
ncbi:hypothetical protein AB670_00023 [Chryseobacterium sp. MOF25P]|uniref:hypothetical protein n=1 Tax=Chryseobacterium TaxID=59732 RepID=UPI0008059681|nr:MULTISPECIES: hypothetical protein [unclassified Chryseobacterium]OBW43494.1 hypothetical protein AB670_00023 [Chryseobacterium sp. MOF25P]OBW46732.1 hypothetical protein AB671_01228 [Chryseobacterium sp. BGARF1]